MFCIFCILMVAVLSYKVLVSSKLKLLKSSEGILYMISHCQELGTKPTISVATAISFLCIS